MYARFLWARAHGAVCCNAACTQASSGRSSAWLALARVGAHKTKRARSPNLVCAPRSAAVLGYALESFVDVWSSVLVLYRFWDDRVEPEAARQRERRASFGISLTVRTPFRALCPGVACPAGTAMKSLVFPCSGVPCWPDCAALLLAAPCLLPSMDWSWRRCTRA